MLNLTLAELSQGLRNREYSCTELTRFFLERCRMYGDAYNCFVELDERRALDRAQTIEKAGANGSPLAGIPLVHKDIFCIRGWKTTCGSRMLDNFTAPYNATVVERLEQAGMITFAKTNMDEFAMGSSGETSYYGPTLNPWDRDRVPGGSSSGSACAVAARLAPAATGTDTGGSIRQPAGFCGVTGLKPTYGRVSRYGMVAFASSLDQAGSLTLSAEDAALMLSAMAGHDPRDSTSSTHAAGDYTSALSGGIAGTKIGIPRQCRDEALDAGTDTVIDEALGELKRQGAVLRDVDLPVLPLAIPAYYVICCAECSSNLSRYDGVRYGYRCEDPRDLQDLYLRSRSEGFGSEVKRRVIMGTFVLSAGYQDAYYLKALRVRRLIREALLQVLSKVDAIAMPTSPTPAFALQEKLGDPVRMYLSDLFTAPANLAGLPAVSVPAGFSAGLPVGLQLVGRDFDEGGILRLAHRYQLATDWHRQSPPAPE